MSDIFIQAAALVLLLLLVGGAYVRWMRRHHASLEANGLLLLVILTMVGGLLGSIGWWTDNPSAFSWDLPPLAARLLAAAGWGFGAAAFMTLQHPTKPRLRLILLMLAVYLIPLALAILVFHMDRFDFALPISYAFFAIVTLMIVPTLWYLYRAPSVEAASEADSRPSQNVRLWLLIVALITALWGAALFITDNGFTPLIWAWTGDLLTSRLIAVMLLTLTAAALYSLRSADAARVTLVVITVYGFGAALASLWNSFANRPIPLLYLLAFALAGVISAVLYLRQPETRPN